MPMRVLPVSLLGILVFGLPFVVGGEEIFRCGFDGPYYHAGKDDKDTIQEKCVNNYQWGEKVIDLRVEKDQDGNLAQVIDIRRISSGAMQFFVPGFSVWRTKYYRVSFRLRADNMAGKLGVCVRKIGGPWTVYVQGPSFYATAEWKTYSFVGKGTSDADSDLGVLFETGSIGTVWIDDVAVESFDTDPERKITTREAVKGNLIPRSSFEGRRDYFWTSGIYADPNGEMEDPQIFRVDGGRYGAHCMGLATASTNGHVFARSFFLPVAAGGKYLFSFWARNAVPGGKLGVVVTPAGTQSGLADGTFEVSDEWQRFALPVAIPADGVDQVFVGFGANANQGVFLLDGFFFGLDDGAPAEYASAFPYELYVTTGQQGGNIVAWGESLPLKLLCVVADKVDSPAPVSCLLRVTVYPDTVALETRVALVPGVERVVEFGPGINGLFRVELIPDGATLAAPQQMVAARLPPPRTTGLDSRFGTHITIRPFFIDYARRIGFKWVRLHDASTPVKWNKAEPEKGERVWFDTPINAVRQGGLQILGLPDCPPKWAQTDPAATGNVIDLVAFEKHCAAVAAHYRGRIDHWEVWNEPYIGYFFGGTPQQFGPVYLAGARGIKRGNPEAKTLGICAELSGIGFLEKVDRAVWPLTDVCSFHCYFQNVTGDGGASFRPEIDAVESFLKDPRPLEFWDSEGTNGAVGENSFYSFLAADPRLNEDAVAFASRVWMETAKGGFAKLFIYTIHQSDTIMYHGGLKVMIGFDRSVTPAAVANAVCAWCIDGLVPVECPALDGVVQSHFRGEDRQVWAVYDDQAVKGRRELDLAAIPGTYQVLDALGNDLRRRGGNRLTIGVTPVYVLGAPGDASLASDCQRAVR